MKTPHPTTMTRTLASIGLVGLCVLTIAPVRASSTDLAAYAGADHNPRILAVHDSGLLAEGSENLLNGLQWSAESAPHDVGALTPSLSDLSRQPLAPQDQYEVVGQGAEYRFLNLKLNESSEPTVTYDGRSGPVIPLPASVALLGLGLAGLLGLYKATAKIRFTSRQRRRRKIKWAAVTGLALALMGLTWFGTVNLQRAEAKPLPQPQYQLNENDVQMIPEPSTGVLLTVGTILALSRPRRKARSA